MNRKALFFDIDGTLINKQQEIPESALKAIQIAREDGHLIFINTGRVYSQLEAIREKIEVDGYLCGCGTYIRINDDVLYHYEIPMARGSEIKRQILQCGFDGVLEGSQGVIIRTEASHIADVEEFRKQLMQSNHSLIMGWEDDSYTFDKMCIIGDADSKKDILFKSLEVDFEIIDRGDNFYECIPAGHSKATAIDRILKKYDISMENTYVFGDSTNDLSMFMHVSNAVLMAEHDKELEPYASFITKSVENDGIAYAMRQLHII